MKANIRKSFLALLFGLIGGTAAIVLYEGVNGGVASERNGQQERPEQKVRGVSQMPNALRTAKGAPENKDFTKASKRSLNAVVHVKTRSRTQGYRDPLELFFKGPRKRQKRVLSAGSGVIVSQDGYIVTNNHVVKNATEIKVVLNSGKTYKAEIAGRDKATDLALLNVEAEGLPSIQYGNSDKVKVGEWVLAVGNPFNLTSTVTAGIVSAKGRSINLRRRNSQQEFFPIESFIQTDAAVNPGNSGGALVDSRGKLVGINTAIASNTGSYTGYSFAIPVNIVKKVVKDLIEYGKVQRAYIGVKIRNISDRLAEEKGLERLEGVYVAGLMEGGGAQAAGIQKNDIITKIGSVQVENVPELQGQVSKYRPGDRVKVTLFRDGEKKEKELTLKNRKGTEEIVKASEDDKALRSLGADLTKLPSKYKEQFGIEHGVQVKELESGKLRKAGVREGFIILSIDRKKVKSVKEIKNYLSEKKDKGVLIGGIYPNGMKAYYGIKT
ncbi:MAG: Do family serine endopeptidase [Flavobacteriales bacterium]